MATSITELFFSTILARSLYLSIRSAQREKREREVDRRSRREEDKQNRRKEASAREELEGVERVLEESRRWNGLIEGELERNKLETSNLKEKLRGRLDKIKVGWEEKVGGLERVIENLRREKDFIRVKGELNSRSGSELTGAERGGVQLQLQLQTVAPTLTPSSTPTTKGLTRQQGARSLSVEKEAAKTYHSAREQSKNHVSVVERLLVRNSHKNGNGGDHPAAAAAAAAHLSPTPIRLVSVSHSSKIAASIVARVFLTNNKKPMKKVAFAFYKIMGFKSSKDLNRYLEIRELDKDDDNNSINVNVNDLSLF